MPLQMTGSVVLRILLCVLTSYGATALRGSKYHKTRSVSVGGIDWNSAPLCVDPRCKCQKLENRDDNGSSGDDEKSGHAKDGGQRLRSFFKASCKVDFVDDDFVQLLNKSTSVKTLILLPVATGNDVNGSNVNADDPESKHLSTIPWKATVRKPPLQLLDLSSVRLSCECENAWLAFWADILTEPLVNADILRSLSTPNRRHQRSATSRGVRPQAYTKDLPIFNDDPTCPYNCGLTTAELYFMPKRILFLRDSKNSSLDNRSNRPFAHCLPPEGADARDYFAAKCDLGRLELNVEKVIVNETIPVSINCSRRPILASINGSGTKSSNSSCPMLKLTPVVNWTFDNDGASGWRSRWPLETSCINNNSVTGQKEASSRNESGWIKCQEPNAYMPQAALAPFMVSGRPQIVHFQAEQMDSNLLHLEFHVVGYPRPRFGWYNRDDRKWHQPNSENGFVASLSSKASTGHFIIAGRATFSELSYRCFKGTLDFYVCNKYGCDKRQFVIPQGMPSAMCPPSDPQPSLPIESFVEPPVITGPKFEPVFKGSPTNSTDEHTSKQIGKNLPAETTSMVPGHKDQENWVYIAVPFLVVFAVVLVGVLTTCLFLRLIGKSATSNNRQAFTRKSSSSRNKSRPSLTDWELSPLNDQHLPSFEVNGAYVDWLQSIKAHVRVFSTADLVIIKELGEGAFGRVYLAKVTFAAQSNSNGVNKMKETTLIQSKQQRPSLLDDVNDCEGRMYAVKLLKNVTLEKLEDLEREAAIMSQLDHPNICQFFGLSCKSGKLALLFEYMEHGDLVNYLRTHSPETENCQSYLQWNDLLVVAAQIANGLEYLADRHLVHRDLAARNCLVGANMVVKISDFGMTRDIYITDYYKMGTRTLVPLRWLPPESILYRKFTVESDMWSFGVLLWEIFSYGKIPWYMYSNSEVLQIIQDGKVLERPDGSPEEVYDEIMLRCWSKHPSERISAKTARMKLEELIEQRLRYCNVLPSLSEHSLIIETDVN